MRRSASNVWPFVLGASAGVLAAVVVWRFASASLQREMRVGSAELQNALAQGTSTLDARFAEGRAQVTTLVANAVRAQVPGVVDQQLRATLRDYGITPENSRLITSQVARVLRWTA